MQDQVELVVTSLINKPCPFSATIVSPVAVHKSHPVSSTLGIEYHPVSPTSGPVPHPVSQITDQDWHHASTTPVLSVCPSPCHESHPA